MLDAAAGVSSSPFEYITVFLYLVFSKDPLCCRMSIYDCMATGENCGVIEAVRDAVTVCDIHMDNSGVISPKSMHEWLYHTTGGGEESVSFKDLLSYQVVHSIL